MNEKASMDNSGIKIPLADPLIGEEEAKAVHSVVSSGWLREGPITEKFEKMFAKYTGSKHAISTSSGTVALHAAMLALGIKNGNEVIVPSLTCVPPVAASLLCGTVPVFADIETDTYNLDPESVRKAISENTRVIIPINYGGHPAQLKELEKIAEENGIILLNDLAQGLGSKVDNKNSSDFGRLSIYSFSPNKTITTGEGGMITTNDDELAEKIRYAKDYGQKGRFNYVQLGNNYHFTEMQAAIGVEQMKKIDRIIELKRNSAKLMTEKLDGIKQLELPSEKNGYKHVYTFYTVKTPEREEVMKKLESAGIQSRVYFPSLHKSELAKKFKMRISSKENTEAVESKILSLPSSPKLTEDQIDYIADTLKGIFK